MNYDDILFERETGVVTLTAGDAVQALAMGLVNEVVPHEKLRDRVVEIAQELKSRGPQALAGLEAAFSAKHAGVTGQARLPTTSC